VAELPGLVLALGARYGPIRQVMLTSTAWDSRFRRLAVGTGVVRMGWFATLDPAVLIATTDRGDQLDLLVVPPQSAAAAAEQAMTAAADPTNTLRAPDILAARAAPQPTAGGKRTRPGRGVGQRGRPPRRRLGRPARRGPSPSPS
jgi:hypothetical protein